MDLEELKKAWNFAMDGMIRNHKKGNTTGNDLSYFVGSMQVALGMVEERNPIHVVHALQAAEENVKLVDIEDPDPSAGRIR